VLEIVAKEAESTVGVGVGEHDEGVTLDDDVVIVGEDFLDAVDGIGEEGVAVGEAGDGVNSEDGVPADVGNAMLKVLEDGGDEGLEELGLVEAAEEAQGDAANKLIGMLEEVTKGLADEDHFGQNSARCIYAVNKLQVEEQQLLHGVVLAGQHVSHHRDEDGGHLLSL
jgi:hypothetical protein